MQWILPTSSVASKSKTPWLLGCCSCQLHKSCAGNTDYSRAKHFHSQTLFFNQNHLPLFMKLSAMNIFTSKHQIKNNTQCNISTKEIFVHDKCILSIQIAGITAIQISSSGSSATMDSCKNSVLPSVL